jgi:hypothetical protein
VGQRASRTGAADGYRLWPRNRADLVILDRGPDASPPPDRPKPPSDDRPPRVRIEDATPGRTVTIVGVVTSPAGLIDSERRRVTVQDRTGAILVRYPDGSEPPSVGRVVRASGEVGTWYGGTQLEASAPPKTVGRAAAVPTILRRPPDESDEWQLVAVLVRLSDLERSGDSWRAEGTMGAGGSLPIAGLTGSGISSDGFVDGQTARVVGIVRRAYPTATDQRFAVAPRTRKDIRLGPVPTEDETGDAGAGGAPTDDDGIAIGVTAEDEDGVLAATLASLEGLGDLVVRVGGRLESIDDYRLTLHDGTASGSVRLAPGLPALEPPLRLGEILNVTGRVRERSGASPEILVRSVADVRRAATLAATAPGLASDARWSSLSARMAGPALSADPSPAAIPAAGTTVPLVIVLVVGSAALVCLLLAAGWLTWRWWSSRPPDTGRDAVAGGNHP